MRYNLVVTFLSSIDGYSEENVSYNIGSYMNRDDNACQMGCQKREGTCLDHANEAIEMELIIMHIELWSG